MATINQNGISFNNYKPQSTNTINMGQWPIVLAGQIDPDEDGGVINAVQIDWNGAEVDENITINTTGDLLSWIKTKAGAVDNAALAEIQNTIDVYQTVFNNVLTKTYGDATYQAKGDYVSVSDYESDMNDIENSIDTKIAEVIGAAPEALDTLKEIADKLGDDDNALAVITSTLSEKANSEDVYNKESIDLIINTISETIENQNQQIQTLQSDNATLLERIKTLEKAFSNLVPQEPEDESYNVIIPVSDEPLTLEEIIASINPEAEKPEVVQSLNMTQLSNPTDTYLVYPLSWEIIENDQIVSPIIKDWNGFEIGFNANEETPTVMVDNVEYRVSDIKLGKGQYTIEFK